MRSRLSTGILALAVAFWVTVGVNQGSDASAGATSGQAATATRPVLASALSLDEARQQVADLQVELQLAVLQKQVDDQHLVRARGEVAALDEEARNIAESTVEGAINAYRNNERGVGLLDLDDQNQALRASTLTDAALVADTEAFSQFYDKQRDLDLARFELAARTERNEAMGQDVAEVKSDLDESLAWLARLEEKRIQDSGRIESARTTAWALSRGRKQGAYLLRCPVDGRHSFIDSWGFPRSGGRRHKGVDILADPGTPIVAPTNGRVEHRSNRVGGRSFHLYDQYGNYFYGTHMSGYGKAGDVKAGEVIGYVGDDGNAAGIPHLHFEIHAGGRGNQINPFADSAAVCSGAQY